MPEVREYRRYGRRYMLANLLAVLPFIPVMIFIGSRLESGRLDTWFWCAAAVFAAGAAFGLWWQAYRVRRMTCPQCRLPIERAGCLAPGRPIHFVCPRCDIEWVTGLYQADD